MVVKEYGNQRRFCQAAQPDAAPTCRRVNPLAHSLQHLKAQSPLAQRTQAMAVGLTNRVWRLNEGLLFKPPSFPHATRKASARRNIATG
jgi:hypothetical protein